MMTNKKPDERLDDLQVKGYEIIQKPGRFCFGMDAVLLSSYAKVKRGEQALDLGTGTGILPILLEAKNPGLHYTGLEVQEESADMARRSVAHNGLENKIDIVTGDIKEASHIFGNDSYEVIVSNPPYMIGEHGLKNDNEALYIARHEALCTLDDLLRESAKVLKMKGRSTWCTVLSACRKSLQKCAITESSRNACVSSTHMQTKSQTWFLSKASKAENHASP